MIRFITNFLITFALIFFGNILFPDYIITDGWQTTAIASVLVVIVTIISAFITYGISLLFGLIFAFILRKHPIIWTILLSIVIFATNIIIITVGIMLISNYLDGFTVTNTLITVIMTVILSIFNTSINVKNKSED